MNYKLEMMIHQVLETFFCFIKQFGVFQMVFQYRNKIFVMYSIS